MVRPAVMIDCHSNQLGTADRDLQLVRAIRWRLLEPEFGVQPLEGVEIQSRAARKLLEVRRARYGDEIVHERRGRGNHEAVPLWLTRNDGRRLDGRHEVLRF